MSDAGNQTRRFPRSTLVVGGSRGMGAACVRALAAQGVRCAIAYVSNDDAARATADASAEVGPRPELIKGDIATDAEDIVAHANDVLGGVDSIVFTAYPHILGRALSVTHEEYERAFGVHYWGTLETVRAAAPSLEAARGAVVVVSSIGTNRYARYYGVLGPAKAAMETLVMYLAAELGPRGIRANAVRPQMVVPEDPADERSDDITGYDKVIDDATRRTPLRRLAHPSDIANVCVSLLSSDFDYVTGQIFAVDGGYTLLA